MICTRYHANIPKGEDMNLRGQILCEDCYILMIEPPRACDPAAVYHATQTRELSGQTGTDGLTALQKEMYAYVRANGKVSPYALAEKFKLSELALMKQFTTLRHCELLKGTVIDGVRYVVIMEGGPGSFDIEP